MNTWFELALLLSLVVLFTAPGLLNLYRSWFSRPVDGEDEQNSTA